MNKDRFLNFGFKFFSEKSNLCTYQYTLVSKTSKFICKKYAEFFIVRKISTKKQPVTLNAK